MATYGPSCSLAALLIATLFVVDLQLSTATGRSFVDYSKKGGDAVLGHGFDDNGKGEHGGKVIEASGGVAVHVKDNGGLVGHGADDGVDHVGHKFGGVVGGAGQFDDGKDKGGDAGADDGAAQDNGAADNGNQDNNGAADNNGNEGNGNEGNKEGNGQGHGDFGGYTKGGPRFVGGAVDSGVIVNHGAAVGVDVGKGAAGKFDGAAFGAHGGRFGEKGFAGHGDDGGKHGGRVFNGATIGVKVGDGVRVGGGAFDGHGGVVGGDHGDKGKYSTYPYKG